MEQRKRENFYSKQINGIILHHLVSQAFEKLNSNLKHYGNKLSPKHSQALHEILIGFTQMAQGVLKGRLAYPLFTGGGKTQSIVAWLWAVNELGYDHISVAVCAHKVEALCDLKRDLCNSGILPDKIGLLHSYRFNPEMAEAYLNEEDSLRQGYASLPSTEDNEDRPILLCTHNLVKGRNGINRFNLYQSEPRSLLIWDESLLQSESRGIRRDLLRSGLEWKRPLIKNWDVMTKKAFEYIDHAIGQIDQELHRQKTTRDGPEVIQLPRLTLDEIRKFKRIFTLKMGHDDILSPIRELLEISQTDLRVVDTGIQSGGFLQYEVVVPEELTNIIILDASYNIRKLCQADKTIRKIAKHSDNIVSYQNVKVHQIKHPAGRNSITKALTGIIENGLLVNEYIDIVKSIPETEGIIWFTFKPRWEGKQYVDSREIIEKAMVDAGINPKARIEVTANRNGMNDVVERPRFAWLTHGNETSMSKYSYCKNEIWVGVLHRNFLELASRYAGQSDNLLAEIDPKLLHEVCESEICYCFHQGFARCSCRITSNGVAKQAMIWVTYKGQYKIRKVVSSVMNDIRWRIWPTKHISTQTEVEKLADRIALYLSKQYEEYEEAGRFKIIKFSTRKIKQELKLTEIPPKRFQRAVELVLQEDQDWTLEGRSLVLRSAAYFGFTPI